MSKRKMKDKISKTRIEDKQKKKMKGKKQILILPVLNPNAKP
jgi:hypothetical protein